jgi:N-dimethylarginine dimethylaminohydrolase
LQGNAPLPWLPLTRALLRPPVGELTESEAVSEWGYRRPRILADALAQHEQFKTLLEDSNVQVDMLEAAPGELVDSCYACDPALVAPSGLLILRPAKAARLPEADLMERSAQAMGLPVRGRILEPGNVEGGDCLWLDGHTLAVGETYRSNRSGIMQLRFLLPTVQVLAIPMVHHNGPEECLHLQSIISFVDDGVAVVYMPLAPVRLLQALQERSVRILPLPLEDFDSLGCNILCVAPGKVIMASGNASTASMLEAAGIEVTTLKADDLMWAGNGGPTCLTLALERRATE